MQFILQRKDISRWVLGIVLPATCGPLALADGLVDPNTRWSGAIQFASSNQDKNLQQCNYPCPQQPCDCLPCPPPGAAPSAKAPSKADPNAKMAEPAQPDGMTTDAPSQDNFASSPPPSSSNFSRSSSGASSTIPGYLDWARITNRVRVRYDDMQNANEPTRAEFFYPTAGAFGGPGPQGGGTATEVDFRQLSTYIEVASSQSFSFFTEVPVNWVDDVDVQGNNNLTTEGGLGDIKAGIRYGLFASPVEWLTLQARVWAPTGDADHALGVGHTSIDLSLLYQTELSERTSFWTQLSDWQSIDAGTAGTPPAAPVQFFDLDANVLQYGFGVGYDLWQSFEYRPKTLTGIVEIVGWTVLDGVITPTDPNVNTTIVDASGDTIVNGKYGARYNWFCGCNEQSVYVGYGHNWTRDRWYSDIFRIEYNFFY